MAKYDNYSEKQKDAMTKLAARASRYKMKIDETNKKLAEPVISFEENQKLRESLKMYKDLFKKASDEINDIAKQRDICAQHIKEAKKHMDAAAALKEKWGF